MGDSPTEQMRQARHEEEGQVCHGQSHITEKGTPSNPGRIRRCLVRQRRRLGARPKQCGVLAYLLAICLMAPHVGLPWARPVPVVLRSSGGLLVVCWGVNTQRWIRSETSQLSE
jgi:hypothetical protein